MAKLVFVAAVMALSVILATASFRTTITIDEEAENPRGQSCQQQMQQQQMLSHCQRYMQEQQRRRGYGDNQEEHLKMCCDQLRQMDMQCRCPAIRRMVEEREMGSEREMMEMAENLPSMCRLQPQRCQFHNEGAAEAIVA